MAEVSRLEIYVGLRDVPKLDLLSESDPFVVLRNNGRQVGITEVVWNNPNPDFKTCFHLPFTFNTMQQLEFLAFDANSNDTRDLSKCDFIGSVTIQMADIVRSQQMKLEYRLSGGKKDGARITISAEEMKESTSELIFTAVPGKSKTTALEFLKSMEGGSYVPVYRSNFAKVFQGRFPLQKIGADDPQRSVKLRIVSQSCFGTLKVHSEAVVPAGDIAALPGRLADSSDPVVIEMRAPALPGKPSRVVERLTFRQARVERITGFVDFLRSGMQLQLQVAVDFTGSNGQPSSPQSLHHYVPGAPNTPTQYHQVLDAVGRILLQYDSDGDIPAFGFGAKINGTAQQYNGVTTVSHLFPLDPLNASHNAQPGVFRGLDQLVQAYYNTITQIEFNGPTNFSPFLQHLRGLAQASHQAMQRPDTLLEFHVGLILTDGVISDLDQTIDEIVALSPLPVAIIIVGVGNADFTKMDILDADDQPLYSRSGRKQCADIVQFVPYNDYAGNPAGLAAAVLEELPGIVTNYFATNHIKPRIDPDFIGGTSSQVQTPRDGTVPAPSAPAFVM